MILLNIVVLNMLEWLWKDDHCILTIAYNYLKSLRLRKASSLVPTNLGIFVCILYIHFFFLALLSLQHFAFFWKGLLWHVYFVHIFFCSFGLDSRSTVLDDISCSSSYFLTLLQCSFSIIINSLCLNNEDISVTCCKRLDRLQYVVCFGIRDHSSIKPFKNTCI